MGATWSPTYAIMQWLLGEHPPWRQDTAVVVCFTVDDVGVQKALGAFLFCDRRIASGIGRGGPYPSISNTLKVSLIIVGAR